MKVEFVTKLRTEYVKNGTWKLHEPFVARIDGEPYVVPAGTVTDLDSVPRLPLAYWLVKGRATLSAVLHDWLYALQKPREWADEVLLEAMKVEGVGSVMRRVIWLGVRAGGSHAYNKKNGG